MPSSVPPIALPDDVRERLEQHFQSNLELPLLPDTAAEVMALCDDENCDAKTLSELICRDQSLAGNVLAVANSAAFAPRTPIDDLRQAVSRLGISTIAEIAMAVALKGQVFRVPGHQTRVREMWMHSAAAGIYAKEIARRLGLPIEQAFLCGLLHDVGRPLVLQALVSTLKSIDGPISSAIAEAGMLVFHEKIGALLVSQWGQTQWMTEAVLHHHDPPQAKDHVELAWVTRYADLLTHWALGEASGEEGYPREDPAVDELGLTGEDLDALAKLRGRVLDIAEAF